MAEEKGNKVTIFTHQPNFQTNFVRSNCDITIGGSAMGVGKRLSVNDVVLTPSGWKRNGDLCVGDKILTPFDGEATILQIFPHDIDDLYKFETEDGRTCHCSMEHLWTIRTKSQISSYKENNYKWGNFSTIETKDIVKMMSNNIPVYIPIPKALDFKHQAVVIEPYTMGVLLGDGCLTSNSKNRISISSSEMDIIERVKDSINGDRIYNNPCNYNHDVFFKDADRYNSYLAEIGLNTKSYNKFIPREYLFNSIDVRKKLLQGLMDTDGYVGDKNRYSFTTTSEKLCDDFIELCRGLGYIAIKHEENPNRSYKYTNGKCFKINIRTNDIIFSSKKHLEKYNNNNSKSKAKYSRTNDHVRIKSITKCEDEKSLCIYIDNDKHLYITNDYIVTHNTFAALLMAAEPSLDPNFRMLIIRKTLNDTKVGGSATDDGMRLYKGLATLKISENPRITFNNGSFIDFTHMNNEDPNVVLERTRGWQYSTIVWEEGTGYQWNTFKTVMGRNRGHGNWTGKIRVTCNPKKTHWLRTFCDWWINPNTGFVIPERDGVVRYMYLKGEKVEDCVFGSSKKEVYSLCKRQIDAILDKVNKNGGNQTYESLIKSVVFYSGVITDNKAMLKENPNYIGSVATMGEKLAMANLQGNWNIDPEEEENIPIPSHIAMEVFENDPQTNNDRWITCDLADVGTDNTLALVWDGFHVIDMVTKSESTPRGNAEMLMGLARKWNIGHSHIIFDRNNAVYMNDYIPEAVGFVSYYKSAGVDMFNYQSLKDECYARFVWMVNNGLISFDKEVANRRYYHIKIKQDISVKTEFLDECSVIRFRNVLSGKKKLLPKDKMNEMLGKDRSMDLLDPCAMRMMPIIQYNKGEELIQTTIHEERENDIVYEGMLYGDNDFDGFTLST